MSKQMEAGTLKEITYSEFIDLLEQGKLSAIEVQPDKERIVLTPVSGGVEYGVGTSSCPATSLKVTPVSFST